MSLSHFDHYAPATLEEVFSLLQSKGPGARVMAGGTDLLLKIRHGALKPKYIIGLKNIRGLKTISFDASAGLTIGATALLAEVARHPDIVKHYPTIAQAARGTANPQIRNMGTVIGNLCNASPAADNAPTLLAMDAQIRIRGPEGERVLPLDQFFKGPGVTALVPLEIVTAVHVPAPPPNTGTAYLSLSARGKMDCTAVGVATMVTMTGKTCAGVRLFVGACGPVPLRAPKAEDILRGQELTEEVVEKAGTQASAESRPISDMRASGDYRTEMVAVLTRRVLREAHHRALAC
ncbi:MAG: FAD binding domain-containing protein [Deltaproteobacteria bacterium]|nr:FAD binding domain-containing protein [Deltaproteobacteria bacterium]